MKSYFNNKSNLYLSLQLTINWNMRITLFPPPHSMYNCTLSALSPRPSEVVNFTLLSYEVQSREVRIVASWEPPAEVNGILQSYTMCTTPTPLQGHEEAHSRCKEGIQVSINHNQITMIRILFLHYTGQRHYD